MKLFNQVYILIKFIIGVIFVHAGVVKLFEPMVFATLIDAYGIVPEVMIMPVATILPLLEVIAGIGLIFDVKGSLTIITALLMIFITVLGYGVSMGLDIDCGCFGQGDAEAKAFHGLRTTLYRDILLLAAIIYLYSWRRLKNIKPLSISYCLRRYFQKEKLGCNTNY